MPCRLIAPLNDKLLNADASYMVRLRSLAWISWLQGQSEGEWPKRTLIPNQNLTCGGFFTGLPLITGMVSMQMRC